MNVHTPPRPPGPPGPGPEASVDAHDLLARSELFAGLEPQAIASVARHLRHERFPAGALIVREGEEADRYYLVGSGEVEVLDAKGRQRARLGPGEGFGETGVLERRPRNAAVRALVDADLLSLERAEFLRLLETHSGLLRHFEEEIALRSVAAYLGASSPFRSVEPGALRWLAAHVRRISVPAGEEIMRQGEPGDALYIVVRGSAEVLVDEPGGGRRHLASVSIGEAFGEQALLSGEPRTATVRAVESMELLRLGRDDFEQIVSQYRDRETYFLQLALRRQRPRHAAGVRLTRADPSDPYWVLAAQDSGQYLKLSERAGFLWDLIDGERTVRDLTLAYLDRYGGMRIDTVLDLVVQLSAAGFLEIQHLGDSPGESAEQQPSVRGRWPALAGLATRYFSLPDVDRRLSALHDGVLRPLFVPLVQAALLVLAVAGVAAFARLLLLGQVPTPPPGTTALIALIGLAGLTLHMVLHELGHAVTCKHFRHTVHRAGLGWYLFLPVAFVDTSDSWTAPRVPRMLISSAGPYVNVVLSSAAALLIPFADPLWAAALASFAALGYAQTLANLNPLVEFDGYFVLMDWVRVPNLRRRAMAYIGGRLRRRGDPAPEPRLRLILGAYGLLSLAYTMFVALMVLLVYRGYVQGFVAGLLPPVAASALGWLTAALMAWLIVRGAWSEMGKVPGPGIEAG